MPEEASPGELRERLAALERQVAPLREQLAGLQAQADAVRGELRRLERRELAAARGAVRAQLLAGEMPTLEQVLASGEPPDATRFDDLAYLRDSATEVRLGYASASRQEVSFTDGAATVDASDLGAARQAWRDGWDFGTLAARGVRVYPVGSRAEKVVPAAEVHVRITG